MALSLLDLQPHQVSRDLRGYSVLFYGAPKTGKTTTACKFPGALLMAFERGYNALPGVYAVPINSWNEFKKYLSELKKPEVQEKFQTIVIDTADIAYSLCEKFICQRESDAQNDYQSVGDIPYGKGYALAMAEFDEQLRKILQMNYGLVIISHDKDKTMKDEQGKEYNQLIPTMDNRARLVCERTCDIIGYAREVDTEGGGKETRLFMRGTPRYIAGSRFRHTPDSIPFNYDALVNAIAEAVEAEADSDPSYVTNESKSTEIYADAPELNFKELMAEFKSLVETLMQKNQSNGIKITQIVEKHLGKGKKATDCTESNAPQLDLIIYDLKNLLG